MRKAYILPSTEFMQVMILFWFMSHIALIKHLSVDLIMVKSLFRKFIQ